MGEWCLYTIPEVGMTIKDYLEILISFLTLGVTIYFTRQLVQNDNRRERRSEDESTKIVFKNRLRATGGARGSLQRVGANLRSRHPGKLELIFQAYEELYSDGMAATYPTPQEFRDAVDEYPQN